MQQGDYIGAKPYLIQAAECMVELAEENKDPKARAEQEEYAAELIELAKDCDRKARTGGGPRGPRRERSQDGDDDDGANAEDWVVREKPNIRFADIAGLDEVKAEIQLKMIYPFQHPELAKHYGVDTGGGLLLYGPPGTGKTMFAKAVSCEIDATMFVLSPAQIMSKWVGESEGNIRKLFEAAKQEEKAVIFFDEVEALVPSRRGSSDSPVMQRVVPQILQELEGFDRKEGRALLFIGATNEPWALDSAMMRPGRLDTKIYVPLPDSAARFKLFEIYLSKRPVDDNVNFAELVELTKGYSGADIKAICTRSASRAFLESIGEAPDRNIRMEDLIAVLQVTPPSVHASDSRKFDEWATGV
ncbi:MAG: 26S protease regulatory subunit [Phycisphaerae bacterium]